jgi:hypothetical protein
LFGDLGIQKRLLLSRTESLEALPYFGGLAAMAFDGVLGVPKPVGALVGLDEFFTIYETFGASVLFLRSC